MAGATFTLAYITARARPRLDWTLEGLDAQARPGDVIELIVVDALGREPSDLDLVPCAPLERVVVTPPKPCVWQGPQRVTSCDWWAMANARNTAIALASHDYVVFMDDRSWLGSRWLEVVRRAERERASVVCGSYDKLEGARVSQDHRRRLAPGGRLDCGGGWLYGCSFALPLEWLLEVNGLEEGCDSVTGEDYMLGLMLANRGRRIDFDPAMLVRQERSSASEHGYAKTDKGVSPEDKSHAAIRRFGCRTRTEYTPDLRALRAHLAAGGSFPDVDASAEHCDWYDGQPIREMIPPP